MEHELLILRHAKSDWDQLSTSDYDRPLNRRGRKDAPRVGRWMRVAGLLPDRVLSSPALRAHETVEAVMGELGLQERTIQFDQSLYLATRECLLDKLAVCRPSLKCVLLVGHNPGLEELLEFLCTSGLPRTNSGKLLTTAALARVRLQQTWESLTKGSGTLVSLTYPCDLADA